MSNVEKLSIVLTPEMAAIVRQCVESGEYASSSQVIREALCDWKLKCSLQQNELAELRSLWQAGLKSGPGRLAAVIHCLDGGGIPVPETTGVVAVLDGLPVFDALLRHFIVDS